MCKNRCPVLSFCLEVFNSNNELILHLIVDVSFLFCTLLPKGDWQGLSAIGDFLLFES